MELATSICKAFATNKVRNRRRARNQPPLPPPRQPIRLRPLPAVLSGGQIGQMKKSLNLMTKVILIITPSMRSMTGTRQQRGRGWERKTCKKIEIGLVEGRDITTILLSLLFLEWYLAM